MKVFLCKDNMYISLTNNNVTYSFDRKDATNFASTIVEIFIKQKEELEKREGVEFELEFV